MFKRALKWASGRRRGITLIMVAGVLTLLAAVGAGFYSVAIMQNKSATRFGDTMRAKLVATAGISQGVASLRELLYTATEDPVQPWYTYKWLNQGQQQVSFAGGKDLNNDNIVDIPNPYTRALTNSVGSSSQDTDRYILKVTDAQSKINVNAGDNLAVLLDNLCRVVGPPMVAADADYLQPARWGAEGADAGSYNKNPKDTFAQKDLYFQPDPTPGKNFSEPELDGTGKARYGDGYAIARYRSIHGPYKTLDDVKNAMTYVKRQNRPDLEELERQVKFAAIRDYITINSWVDTNTICTGKFEWTDYDMCIDRDKSWAADVLALKPESIDFKLRGSLRGCMVSIINGHGAGQLRRIKTNGMDWIQLEEPFEVTPGPTSSYMIIAKEDALIDDPKTGKLRTNADGTTVDDPNIDYLRYPLCIHRSPINVNTASDKVLMALFLGLNVQHGHPMAVGTDADQQKVFPWPLPKLYSPSGGRLTIGGGYTSWLADDDALRLEPQLLTPKGMKRIPADSGKLVLDRPKPWDAKEDERFGYLNNYGSLGAPNWVNKGDKCNEVHELAYRIIVAREWEQLTPFVKGWSGQSTGQANNTNDPRSRTFARGPFRSWDDFYFRVVKPWDDRRVVDAGATVDSSGVINDRKKSRKISVARMIMAHFNSNTNILKYNPNIEWIDRWGRNFTEMESIMVLQSGSPRYSTAYHLFPYPKGDGGKDPKVEGTYYLHGRRYKSDEMIDQTDMNRSTTQLLFDSAGIFEIQSTGQVMKDDLVLAERKLTAVVKIYDVWRESNQRQFTRGNFSRAQAQNRSNPLASTPHDRGSITRDRDNKSDYLALNSGPEPLSPLGRTPPADSNSGPILPAMYDGYITLATNTTITDGSDTFCASFDGTLNADNKAQGGGTELLSVIDTIGLLGELTPKIKPNEDPKYMGIDSDPTPPVNSIFFQTPDASMCFPNNDPSCKGPDFKDQDPLGGGSRVAYWYNIQTRMGDMRGDGLWMGACGVSGKDGSLKYNPSGNWNLGTSSGGTFTCWFKPNWHIMDGYEHEFMNCTDLQPSKTFAFTKGRPYAGTATYDGTNGNQVENRNCLTLSIEDANDTDYFVALHDGRRKVDRKYVAEPGNDATTGIFETPAWKTQPFRWSHIGFWVKYHAMGEGSAGGGINNGACYGYRQDNPNPAYVRQVTGDGGYGRPFIDSQRYPEGKNWKPDCQIWLWRWGTTMNPYQWNKLFIINGADAAIGNRSIGRAQPTIGTDAVVDEYRLASVQWDSDRIHQEQTLSRYYLPAAPENKDSCPTFISQSMLESLIAIDPSRKPQKPEEITLARVSWTVFTPRFMHEYKEPTYTHIEYFGDPNSSSSDAPKGQQVEFRGPYDYAQYNRDIEADAEKGWKESITNPYLGVDRFPARLSEQSHYSAGVEVELLKDDGAGGGGTILGGTTFYNPDIVNNVGTADKPVKVRTDQLRYRVRFKYPVDPEVDPKCPGGTDPNTKQRTVNPTKHYMLDTPVFDDISITYFTTPRFLSYKENAE